VVAGVSFQPRQHQLAETEPAKLRTDVHSFKLSVLGPEELNASAARRSVPVSGDEEGYALVDQLLHAVSVAAGRRVVRAELGLELGD